MEEDKYAQARNQMVNTQLIPRGIRDPRVLAAMRRVPRHRFVPSPLWDQAHNDYPLPIGEDQTISQPYIVALMVQELRAGPTDRVLDVGAGSGYQAAVLSRLAKHVYAIERLPELADQASSLLADLGYRNVTIRLGDGTLGWPEEAPFDGIICGAAAPDIPPAWIEQLAEGGWIVAPVGGADSQTLLVAQKIAGRLDRRYLCGVRFVKLIGQEGWEG